MVFSLLEKHIGRISALSTAVTFLFLLFGSFRYSVHSDLLGQTPLQVLLLLCFSLPFLVLLYPLRQSPPSSPLRISLLLFHLIVLALLAALAISIYRCEIGIYDWVFQTSALSLRRLWSPTELYLHSKLVIASLERQGAVFSYIELSTIADMSRTCSPSADLFRERFHAYLKSLQESPLVGLVFLAGGAFFMVASALLLSLFASQINVWEVFFHTCNGMTASLGILSLAFIIEKEHLSHYWGDPAPPWFLEPLDLLRPFVLHHSALVLLSFALLSCSLGLVLAYLLRRILYERFPRP